ncbi:hypothetical protein XCR_3067 [Xanthomonas campestris pv. raphani 756C]|nr:hypothetical protein XCR_3067 [Xanthomonas campestris pv. raphani 756C]
MLRACWAFTTSYWLARSDRNYVRTLTDDQPALIASLAGCAHA